MFIEHYRGTDRGSIKSDMLLCDWLFVAAISDRRTLDFTRPTEQMRQSETAAT